MFKRISVCATIVLLVVAFIIVFRRPAASETNASTASARENASSGAERPKVIDDLPKDYQPPSLGRRAQPPNLVGRPQRTSSAFNPMIGGSPKPPILDVPIRNAEDSQLSVQPDDLVLGLEINGQARAYPVTQLCGPNREIINDHVGGQAIAATW